MTITAATDAMEYALEIFAKDWSDPNVQDIFVVAPGAYFVKRGTETIKRDAPSLDSMTVEAIGINAAHLRGQYADEQSPLLDCELPSGERLSIVLPPCTPAGKPSLSLRRASVAMPSLDELESQGLWEKVKTSALGEHIEQVKYAKSLLAAGEMVRFFRYAIAQRWSFGIVGPTGSGKTHSATALVMEIPREDRIVTVADTEEWARLPHENRVSFLHARGGPITMEQLIEAALRNAPRWLLVQEVRGAEAFAFLRALASGHPGITTWHARSADEAFDALSVMVRQHPAGARLSELTLRNMFRGFIDVVMHVRRESNGEFRATDIKFGMDLT